MTIYDVTKENLEEIPLIKWGEDTDQLYNGVLIVPNGEIHDSGFECMDFIFCRKTEVLGRVSRCSDVLHIDGIGGYGDFHPTWNNSIPKSLPIRGWSIDCTPKGFIRLFSTRCNFKIDTYGLSDFSIYGVDKKED